MIKSFSKRAFSVTNAFPGQSLVAQNPPVEVSYDGPAQERLVIELMRSRVVTEVIQPDYCEVCANQLLFCERFHFIDGNLSKHGLKPLQERRLPMPSLVQAGDPTRGTESCK